MFKSEEKNGTHSSTAGDDLGKYPADVDNNPTKQRVMERVMRMAVIGLAASALVNVALAALFIAVFPLKQVVPFLVTFKESDDQVVALEPLMGSAPGIQYATEANVRQYVKLRHSFAPVNSQMDAQWGPDSQLAAMTAREEYNDFKNASEVERTKMMSSGYTRLIDIESATMIRPDTWQVAFTTIDSLGGNGGTLTADPTSVLGDKLASGPANIIEADLTPRSVRKKWLATMTIDYQPQQVSYDKRLLNPLGFTITDYSVTARN